MSSTCTSVLPLEYQDAGGRSLGLPPVCSLAAEPAAQVMVGILESEVEARIQIARDDVIVETERRVRSECERASEIAQQKIAETLKAFSDERAVYFKRVEGEVVQLALAIARKILQREAEVDPTLLAALVRIAIERMDCGSLVRIRVAADDAEIWRKYRDAHEGSLQWEVAGDKAMEPGDCIVETELGTANFGFAAQLRDVEESFMQLLAHRPEPRPHHVEPA